MADDADGIMIEPVQSESLGLVEFEGEGRVALNAPLINTLDKELALITLRVMSRKIVAQAFCKTWGPPDGCYCKGNDERCHASLIYDREARNATTDLERYGVIK